jgi:hypothetical protein
LWSTEVENPESITDVYISMPTEDVRRIVSVVSEHGFRAVSTSPETMLETKHVLDVNFKSSESRKPLLITWCDVGGMSTTMRKFAIEHASDTGVNEIEITLPVVSVVKKNVSKIENDIGQMQEIATKRSISICYLVPNIDQDSDFVTKVAKVFKKMKVEKFANHPFMTGSQNDTILAMRGFSKISGAYFKYYSHDISVEQFEAVIKAGASCIGIPFESAIHFCGNFVNG